MLLGGFALLGLWQGSAVVLGLRAQGYAHADRAYLWEITGTLATWAVMGLPMAGALNAPRPGGRWGRFLAVHAGLWLSYSGLKSLLMLSPRFVLYPMLGWGDYTYERWPLHLSMEALKDGVGYSAIALVYGLIQAWRVRQVEALRAARLEAELREAQLSQLTGQLDPHFLFNALNTVSSVMYEDLARTDALLQDLGQLLRAGLERRGPTWTLGEEEAHLRRYGALLLARFGDRLSMDIQMEGASPTAQVPRFVLQRLVENAVKHNQEEAGSLHVRVAAQQKDCVLLLTVEDDGVGFADADTALEGPGHGLRGLSEVLRLLHGGQASLSLARGATGGARVDVAIPGTLAP